MKVFGIGMGRTGTTSLHDAFTILGLKSIHYPRDLSVIDSLDAAADISLYYKELDKKYPGSRFIVTVRNIKDWLDSVERFSRTMPLAPPTPGSNWMRRYGTVKFEEPRMQSTFLAHYAEVEAYFKGREAETLTMNIPGGDGWEKLCPFLGKPIPNVPFPYSNKSKP